MTSLRAIRAEDTDGPIGRRWGRSEPIDPLRDKGVGSARGVGRPLRFRKQPVRRFVPLRRTRALAGLPGLHYEGPTPPRRVTNGPEEALYGRTHHGPRRRAPPARR